MRGRTTKSQMCQRIQKRARTEKRELGQRSKGQIYGTEKKAEKGNGTDRFANRLLDVNVFYAQC